MFFKLNPELQKTFQNNTFVVFKRNKNLQEIIGGPYIKPIQKIEKENVNLATKINHHYVASRLLTLVHSEVTKHSN